MKKSTKKRVKKIIAEDVALCQITGRKFPLSQLVAAPAIRSAVVQLIKRDHPNWMDDGYVSMKELNKYKQEHVRNLLEEEAGKLSRLEKKVLKSIQNSEILSRNIEPDIEEDLTIGQRVADKVAEFGGSWGFITLFFLFIAAWMTVNVVALVKGPFDPYPFILLNLVLSCLAAIQAPVIMMSQNRQEVRDRTRSEHDYQINLKAELEIQQLHEKLDHLMNEQGRRLLEIQDIQVELMESILESLEK